MHIKQEESQVEGRSQASLGVRASTSVWAEPRAMRGSEAEAVVSSQISKDRAHHAEKSRCYPRSGSHEKVAGRAVT